MLLLSLNSLIIVASLIVLISIGINSVQVYADPTYRIAATGDIGCSTNGQNTVNQIKNQNPNLVLWLGDLSYVDSNIDCFISQTSQLASKDEAVIGNHEDSEDGSNAARTHVINHFGLPSNGYYSKTLDVSGTQRTDDILLVGMDTQSSITSSSSQFTFVRNSLQNSNSPLKIVIVHKPFLSCSCSHSSNGQFNTYQAIFKQFGVDIVLQAHNHNIQFFNPIDNVKYIVSGAGGRSHYSLTSSPQPAHYRNSASYGFTLIDADFATNQLQGKFITNSGVDQTSSHFTQSFFAIPPQAPPVANNQVISTNKNTAKDITLTATDVNNDVLTYTVVTPPAHGTLSGTAPNLNYNPSTDYVGPDSFTFKANDGTADSNIATVSITVQDTGPGPGPGPGPCTTNLPISGVTASGNDGNVPSNVLDNNLATRWSSLGVGQWIRADLGSIKNICSVDIAWYNGNARQYHFVIATSTDGITFTNKFSGDSSGTTLNSEKYTFSATNARYVRVTVNGNTVNTWASITELDIFGTSSAVSNIDQFGIIKLYQTKNGGEEWFMNMANPLGDSRFNPRNTITQNPDGSWKMKSTQVRMEVYTSTGYDLDDITTLDHSAIASKGYMQAPNDWRNFEMTQYVNVNTSPSDDNFSPNGRGGKHTLIDTPPVGCEGSSMKGDVFFSGQVRFAKEQWHVSYVFTNLKTPTGSIEDKWVGIKFIVYNFVENNKVVVKTELWLDTNNNGNFVKVDENVDRGGWGTEGGGCGGAPDQIISWGGPITTFRWDTATDVDFKNLSVREIIPPQ
jgi:hypothetical protein